MGVGRQAGDAALRRSAFQEAIARSAEHNSAIAAWAYCGSAASARIAYHGPGF